MFINFVFSLTFIYIGACIGGLISFLDENNRIPNFRNLFTKMSMCPHCQKEFKKIENIPIVSFILQKSLCSYCGIKLPLERLLLEVISANLFGILYFFYGFSLKYIFAILIITSALAISYVDIKYMIIPIYLQVYFGFCAIIFILFNPIDPLFSIFCAILYHLIINLCVIILKKFKNKEIVGDADKILFLICGLILKLESLSNFLIISGLNGIVTFYLFKKFNKENSGGKFPFAPAILISLLICLII